MFKTILATATAALIATAIAAPAQADGSYWGKIPNGVEMNGMNIRNGAALNGQETNGQRWNGQRWNGQRWNSAEISTQGFVLDGIELPASVR
ncbi:MAG: hypothetical protein FJX11_18445 [Alphaproteobacteria bacterium]|nr:hypothetical protein [Alphaproteobacteria bacterium]